MKLKLIVNIAQVDGPPGVDFDDIALAITEELVGIEFEAGDEPSVFEINDADGAEWL